MPIHRNNTDLRQAEIQAKLPGSQSDSSVPPQKIGDFFFVFFTIIHPTAEENQLVHYQANKVAFKLPTLLNKTRLSKQASKQSQARRGITT